MGFCDVCYRCVAPIAANYPAVNKFAAILWYVVPVLLSIAPITVGLLYFDDCIAQPYLTIYLIVFGVGLAYLSISWLPSLFIKNELLVVDNNGPPSCLPLRIFNLICCLFMLGWFIQGSIWVFSLEYSDYKNSTSPVFCDYVVYRFSNDFTVIMIFIIAILVPSYCFALTITTCVITRLPERKRQTLVDESRIEFPDEQEPIIELPIGE